MKQENVAENLIDTHTLKAMSTALGLAVEGISQLDAQGQYLFVNEAYARMVGSTPAAMVGMHWEKTVALADRERAIAAYKQMLTSGKVELEVKGLRTDGSTFDKALMMVCAYDEQRRFIGHYCFMKDITRRKQRELQLQQQLEQARLITGIADAIRQTLDLDQILSAAVGQVRHFLQTDRVIIFRFQPNWQGIVEAESVAPNLTKTLAMQIEDSCFTKGYADYYRQGRVSAIANIKTADIDPCYVKLLQRFQVKANLVVPILQGEHLWGLLIAHHCTAPRAWIPESTQLLQQVAAQLGLAIQQAELYQKTKEQAALIDIATDAIFVRDLKGRILFWSKGAHRLYGWSAAEAIGQTTANLLKKRSPAALEVAINTTLEQGFWQGELNQSTKSGQKVIVSSRWSLVKDKQGKPQSLLEVNTDITEKKRLATQFYQAQKLESLGQLASGIAHDLGNMLTPILGIAQLLQTTHKDADAITQRQLNLLEKSAKRGVNMVRQILTFAQASAEKETIVDVVSLLQEVIDVVRQGLPNTIEIRQSIPPPENSQPLRREVFANSTHLHQVFMNLCINARDAMPTGGILTLSVADQLIADPTLSPTAAAATAITPQTVGHYVLVTVADTGTGIPNEICDRIFEPFFTTKQPGQGTGLGLPTSLGIIKSAGGFLQIVSEVNQGTQMKVYLPLAHPLTKLPNV